MSETGNADVIERVRKLFAKTELRGCTEAEAAMAFQKATRIMAEHNLDMTEAEQKDNGEESWTEEDAAEMGRWTLEDNLAYGIVRKHFFVEGFFSRKHVGTKQVKVLRFFGRPANIATATWAFTSLRIAFDRLFHEYRKSSGAPASDRRIFISGVASGFSEKMTEERKAMEIERDLVNGKATGSTALAVVSIADQTMQAYQAAHASFFKSNGKPKGGGSRLVAVTGSNSALTAGHQAGRSLNLNRSLSGSQCKKLGS